MTDECRDLIIAGATVLVAVGGITCFAIGVKQGAKRERLRTKSAEEVKIDVAKSIVSGLDSTLPLGDYKSLTGTGTFGELVERAKECGVELKDDTPVGGVMYFKLPAIIENDIEVE